MYEAFFGMNRRPFSSAPDAGCCASVGAVQQAYDELCDCLEHGNGIAVLTGPAGTGKTLLCLKILEDLSEQFRGVCLPSSNFSDCKSLLKAVAFELQQPYTGLDEQELRLQLISAARQERQAGKTILLVVDEAHLLGEALLEEIRSITNLIENGESLVRVLLCGQLALEETMASPSLVALNQRIGCHKTLELLTQRDSIDYVEFRLKLAGAQLSDIFTEESLKLIAEVSDGNPRCLNQLCDHALVLGYTEEEKPVSATIVRQALNDLKQLPLQWNDALSSTETLEQSSAQHLAGEESSHFPEFEEELTGGETEKVSSIEIGGSQELVSESPETGEFARQDQAGTTETDVIPSEQTDDVVRFPEQDDSCDQFDDELVEDHYATIDARKEQTGGTGVLESSDGDEELNNATSFTEEIDEADADFIPFLHDPYSNQPDCVWFTSEDEIPSSPIQDRHTVPVSSPVSEAEESTPNDEASDPQEEHEGTTGPISIGIAESTRHLRLDVETEDSSDESIGSTVIDTSLKSISDFEEETNSKPLFNNGNRLKLPVRFDVVQPDGQDHPQPNDLVVREPSSNGETASEAVAGEKKITPGRRRNFDHLFSELRRSRLA